MSTPTKPASLNIRNNPAETFFTPKPIMPTTTRKNGVKHLGTPGSNASVNINGANGAQRQLNFGASQGGKRKTQRRKHHRKSKKRTTKSRA